MKQKVVENVDIFTSIRQSLWLGHTQRRERRLYLEQRWQQSGVQKFGTHTRELKEVTDGYKKTTFMIADRKYRVFYLVCL